MASRTERPSYSLNVREALLFSLIVFVLATGRALPAESWQPPIGHTQIPLWPGTPPSQRLSALQESVEQVSQPKELVAGRPWLVVKNVSIPTLTVYPPQAANTGIAIVVYPGGGFQELAIDLEGSEVCDWLTPRGITCVLLKYRVPEPRSAPYWGAYPGSPMSLEDAQRAMGLVRLHAKDWGINPARVGVLGFSAGGHLVTAMSVHFARRVYPPVDAADRQSCRPDFAIALYPGHLGFRQGSLALNPDIAHAINAHTPPTFLLQNENDDVDSIWDALSYEAALIKAKVPVEFHSYAEGGHAFGLRRTSYPATGWPDLVEAWLHTIHMLPDHASR